jgi:hypothetical protein
MTNTNERRLDDLEKRLRVVEDREAIVKLKATYVNLNDGGWKGPTHQYPEEVARLFTADGIWDGRPDIGYARGTEDIKRLFGEFQVMPFIIHYVTNPLIEIDGDEASGHWHAIVTANLPDSSARWVLGLYHDTYRRTADGWKFTSLIFETAANCAYEEGWGKLAKQLHDAG